MTREEAEKELRDELEDRIMFERGSYLMKQWKEIAISERIAHREAEAKVKELAYSVELGHNYRTCTCPICVSIRPFVELEIRNRLREERP